MKHLIPLQIDETTTIYVEPSDNLIESPASFAPPDSQEVTRGKLGLDEKGKAEVIARQAMQSFQALETTLRAYTKGTLNVFKELGSANVDKVQLEFGVNVGGEAGVPYVTKGTAECSLKITVECSFPSSKPEKE